MGLLSGWLVWEVGFVGRWGQSYTIDPWANLNQITNTKGTSTSMSAAIDPDNNLHSNTRDSAGNTTADGNHTYTWDPPKSLPNPCPPEVSFPLD